MYGLLPRYVVQHNVVVLGSALLADEVLGQPLPVLLHGAHVGHLELLQQDVGQFQRGVVPELRIIFIFEIFL